MASVSIEMDNELMEDFSKLCDDLGMSVNTAITVFAKAAVRKHGIPFKVKNLDENGFTPATVAELKRRLEDIKAGRNLEEHDLIDV